MRQTLDKINRGKERGWKRSVVSGNPMHLYCLYVYRTKREKKKKGGATHDDDLLPKASWANGLYYRDGWKQQWSDLWRR